MSRIKIDDTLTTLKFKRPESFIFDSIEQGLRYGYSRFLKKNRSFVEDIEKIVGQDKANDIFEVLDKYRDELIDAQMFNVKGNLYEMLNFEDTSDE